MRDDDRRRKFDDEDDLFRELNAELDGLNAEGTPPPPSLGPKGEAAAEPFPAAAGAASPPATEPADAAGWPREGIRATPAGPAAYPPEGFDSDEDLGRLPNLSPAAPRHRSLRRPLSVSGPSRLILAVVCLAVIGAVFLFWRPGGKPEPPLGIGERTTVVTPGSARTTAVPAQPVSGDVDIAAATPRLVPEGGVANADAGAPVAAPNLHTPTARTPTMNTPTVRTPGTTTPTVNTPVVNMQTVHTQNAERPAGSALRLDPTVNSGTKAPAASGTARATGSEPPRRIVSDNETSPTPAAGQGTAPASVTAPQTAPPAAATPPAATAAPPADAGPQPSPTGAWALQLGAFSTQENAEALATKLRGQGLDPHLQTGGGARGALVFKVTVGYFATREEAAAFARRNARVLGTQALPIHR